MDEKFNHYKPFEEFLFSEIKRKWKKDRPQDFMVCDAVGDEYEKCNHSSYSWYMKVINGNLPSNVYNRLSDAALYQNGYEVIENPRERYIDGVWNKEDVNDWLTEIQVPVRKK